MNQSKGDVVLQPHCRDPLLWRLRCSLIKLLAGRTTVLLNARVDIVDNPSAYLFGIRDCPHGICMEHNAFPDVGEKRMLEFSARVSA